MPDAKPRPHYWKRALRHTFKETGLIPKIAGGFVFLIFGLFAMRYGIQTGHALMESALLGLGVGTATILLEILLYFLFVAPVKIYDEDGTTITDLKVQRDGSRQVRLSPLSIASCENFVESGNQAKCLFLIRNNSSDQTVEGIQVELVEIHNWGSHPSISFPVILLPENGDIRSIHASQTSRWIFFLADFALVQDAFKSTHVCYAQTGFMSNGQIECYPPVELEKDYSVKIRIWAKDVTMVEKKCSIRVSKVGPVFKFTLNPIS